MVPTIGPECRGVKGCEGVPAPPIFKVLSGIPAQAVSTRIAAAHKIIYRERRVLPEIFRREGLTATDQIGGFLRYHDDGCVDVATGHVRHNRCIYYAKSLRAPHP